MAEIAAMTERVVQKAKEYDRDTIPGDYATLSTPCPELRRRGQGKLPPLRLHGQGRWRCRGRECGFSMTKIPAGRSFEAARGRASCCATARLVRWRASARRRAGRSRPSCAWCATRKLANWKMEIRLRRRRKKDEDSGEAVDFSAQTSLGTCPKCGGAVYAARRQLRVQQRHARGPRPPATSRAARSSCSSR